MANVGWQTFQTDRRVDLGVQTFHQPIACSKDCLSAAEPCVAEVVQG